MNLITNNLTKRGITMQLKEFTVTEDLVLLPPLENEESNFVFCERSGLAINEIKEANILQPREKINLSHIKALVEILETQQELDPLVVFWDCNTQDYWLADGYHRLQAYREAKIEDAIVDIYEGDLRQAILYTAQANHANKATLSRSNKDKKKAVDILLNDDDWQLWSNSKIAAKAKVSQSFVSRLRNNILNHNQKKVDQFPQLTIEDIVKTEPEETKTIPTLSQVDAEDNYEIDRGKALKEIYISFKSNLEYFSIGYINDVKKLLHNLYPDTKVKELEDELEGLREENQWLKDTIKKLSHKG